VTTGDYFTGMKVVGIKQLKAHLSEYIRLAKAGETVLVTERDDVVAELRPARRQTPVGEDLDDLLEALAVSGEVTRAARAKGDWTWTSRGLGLPQGTAQAVLDQLREDRP
jgi:antitoxin (DNA-binding transcriptional repressor) of toxin-antitoxin stability system